MTTYASVFGNALLPPVYNNFNSITFAANVQLAWSTQFQNGPNVVSTIMNFNATGAGLTVTLPDATQTSVGAQFYANNIGGNAFNLLYFGGGVLATIAPGTYSIFYLADNSTQNGTWFRIQGGGGFSAVTSVNATTTNTNTDENLLITGTPGLPITGVGTINFEFIGDLAQLINFGAGTGIAVRTSAAPIWALRQILPFPGQTVPVNGNGVAGDIQIQLANNITGINSIQAGNLQLGPANTLSAFVGDVITLVPQTVTNTNFPFVLLGPNGLIRFNNNANTHFVSIQGPTVIPGAVDIPLRLPETAPADGQALYNITGGQLGWANFSSTAGATVAGTLPVYVNNAGGLGDTGIAVSAFNDVTGVTSMVVGNLQLALAGPATISTGATAISISPGGLQNTIINSTLNVASGNSLVLSNALNTGSGGFTATTTPGGTNNLWQLPLALGVAKSFLTTSVAGTSVLTFASLVTTDNVPKAYASVAAGGSGGAPAGSINVTSVAAGGAGLYTVTLTNAMANTTYTFSGVVSGANNGYVSNFTVISATQFTYNTYIVNPVGPTVTAANAPVTFQVFGQFAT